MENVESQARPQTAIRHPKLAMVSMLLGAFVGMSPAQTAALNALSGREAGDGSTILNTVQQVVGALATALATSCLELGRPKPALRPGPTSAFTLPWP